MTKAPEQIDEKPDADEAHQFTSYTRTDVAQAQVAAAYEAAASARGMWFGFNSQGEPTGEYCTVMAHDPGGMSLYISQKAIRALTPTNAKVALDRIVQEAVKEERRRIYKMLCDMGEAEFQVNNSHDAQLLYHAAAKVAALKGGEA